MATTIKRSFRVAATIIDAAELSGTTETLSADVDNETDGYEASHVTVDVTWHASGTVDVDVSIYGSLNGSDYDDVAYMVTRLPVAANTTKQYSFVVPDLLHFKVGVKHVASEANEAIITAIEQSWRRITA